MSLPTPVCPYDQEPIVYVTHPIPRLMCGECGAIWYLEDLPTAKYF